MNNSFELRGGHRTDSLEFIKLNNGGCHLILNFNPSLCRFPRVVAAKVRLRSNVEPIFFVMKMYLA